MRLRITNNLTGEESSYESEKRDVLIGSGKECDIILTGENILTQHTRLVHASNHLFMISELDQNGEIESIMVDPSDNMSDYKWRGNERRIDRSPLNIGQFTIVWG